MNIFRTVLAASLLLAVLIAAAAQDSETIAGLRRARDRADLAGLAAAAARSQQEISQKPSFQAYLELARIEEMICEAGSLAGDKESVKKAAEAGREAAEKAIALNPDSSEAHRLLGSLLSQLIPHVFGGAFRYGEYSSQELKRAIELDPNNADAHIARGASYFFTPEKYGGGNRKAAEELQKALASNPPTDTVATVHVWLAQVYNSEGRREDAVREIEEALKLNPGRRLTIQVCEKIKQGPCR